MQAIECIALATGKPVPFPSDAVICLGNFDGVHIAHRALLHLAVQTRQKSFPNAACAVFCFREPSSDYLFPNVPPAHLCTAKQKLHYFYKEGMEYAFLADFPSLMELSPKAFAADILKDVCHCVAAVCGFNYRFGKNGSGSAEDLETVLEAPVRIQSKIEVAGQTVSSTRIRNLLTDGQTEEATSLLGRPYGFSSEVIHGKAFGRTHGIPTANQFFPEKLLIPKHGVYITDCILDDQCYRGVSNVGTHPTVDRSASVNCETHLLNFSGNLYGKSVEISFLKFLRPEQKFLSAAALFEQITADAEVAKHYRIL